MKEWHEMTGEEQLAEIERRRDRRARGLPLHETEAELAARVEEEDRRLEKSIQWDCERTLKVYGFKVYHLSQARATKQSPGLPDVIAISPWRRQLLFLEVKTPTGEQSEEQRDFQVAIVQLALINVQYVLGGVRATEEYLISIGAAVRLPDGSIDKPR